MTLELQQSLTRELNDALSIGDPIKRSMAVDTAMVHMLIATVDCQRKTGERVKRLLIAEDRRNERRSGFALCLRYLKYAAAACVGGLALNLNPGAWRQIAAALLNLN